MSNNDNFRGISTGWTGDISNPLLQEGVLGIDADPISFLEGKGSVKKGGGQFSHS